MIYDLIHIGIKILSYSPQSILYPIQLTSSMYKTYKWFYPTQQEPIIFIIDKNEDNESFTIISKV